MQAKVIIVCLVTALAIGCAKVRVVGHETDPVEHEIVVHRFGWNLNDASETREIRVGRGKTIGAVKVSMNYFQALGTVLTFGLWMPFDLTWEVNR